MRINAFSVAVIAFALLAACGFAPAGQAPAGWHSGVGDSQLVDPFAAGDEAAGIAKEKLGGVPAKWVMVCAAIDQVTPELIDGVAKHFPANIVYGCQVASPLTATTNYPDVETIDIPAGVSVWALGGDTDVQVAVVETDQDDDDAYFSAGEKLGNVLRPAREASTRPGNVIVTFGDQYNGANKDFALGLNDGLQDVYNIIGAAAGNITAKVIVKGEIVTGVNVGALISGDFRLGQAMNGGTHTPETADQTLKMAIGEVGDAEPFFALIFNCRRRRQGMIERKQLAEELEVIKGNLKGIDFFGFYGPGEIGAEAADKPARGVGFTVVTAVFFPPAK